MDIRNYLTDAKSVVDESSDDENGEDNDTDHQPIQPKTESTDELVANGSSEDLLHRVSQKEVDTFIDQILDKIDPQLEKMSNKLAAERFDWKQIQFKNFSPEQCQNLWQVIQAHQRKYRTMRELLIDAKSWNAAPRKYPGQPKKPPSAYMLFFKKEFKKMKEKDPTVKCTEASKVIGEKFKQLTPKKKAHLQEQVTQDVDAYKSKMALFREEHPDLVPPVKAKPKSEKPKSEKPKSEKPQKAQPPPVTRCPMKIFSEEKMSNANGQKTDLPKLREEWAGLDPYQKAIYIHKAKQEFLEKIKEDPTTLQTIPTVNKEEEKLYLRVLGVPVKPPLSGYSLFSQEFLCSEEAKLMPKSNEKMKILSQKWNELDDAKKKHFIEVVKQKNDQYTQDYGAFLQKLTPEEAGNFLRFHILPDTMVYQVKMEGELDITENEGPPQSLGIFNGLLIDPRDSCGMVWDSDQMIYDSEQTVPFLEPEETKYMIPSETVNDTKYLIDQLESDVTKYLVPPLRTDSPPKPRDPSPIKRQSVVLHHFTFHAESKRRRCSECYRVCGKNGIEINGEMKYAPKSSIICDRCREFFCPSCLNAKQPCGGYVEKFGAREYFKKKMGDTAKWKNLEPEEKEKWKRKFEKRKRKHENSIADTTQADYSALDVTSPLYKSTPNPMSKKKK